MIFLQQALITSYKYPQFKKSNIPNIQLPWQMSSLRCWEVCVCGKRSWWGQREQGWNPVRAKFRGATAEHSQQSKDKCCTLGIQNLTGLSHWPTSGVPTSPVNDVTAESLPLRTKLSFWCPSASRHHTQHQDTLHKSQRPKKGTGGWSMGLRALSLPQDPNWGFSWGFPAVASRASYLTSASVSPSIKWEQEFMQKPVRACSQAHHLQ